MAKISYSVHKKNVDEYIEKIKKLDDDKFKEPLTNAGIYFLRQTDKRFRAEKSPDGVPWKNKDGWELRRRKGKNKKYKGKILQDTGRLRQSVTPEQNGDSINRLSNGVLEVGTSVEYASYLQFGTKFMEPKPFLGLSSDGKDQQVIDRIFLDWGVKRMLKL